MHHIQTQNIFSKCSSINRKKNILKLFGKIQSVNFPTVNNIFKFHENRRKKSSGGVGGLKSRTYFG